MLDFTLAKITYLSQANLTRLFCNGANMLLTVITQQIHVAKQKHAFIQHPFDKGWHELHSILLTLNDNVSTEKKFHVLTFHFRSTKLLA